jgi:hypothetical protein
VFNFRYGPGSSRGSWDQRPAACGTSSSGRGTYRAFRSISKAVKPGGKLYVQLYRRRPAWIHLVNVSMRAATTRMPMRLLHGLCYVATPFTPPCRG